MMCTSDQKEEQHGTDYVFIADASKSASQCGFQSRTHASGTIVLIAISGSCLIAISGSCLIAISGSYLIAIYLW